MAKSPKMHNCTVAEWGDAVIVLVVPNQVLQVVRPGLFEASAHGRRTHPSAQARRAGSDEALVWKRVCLLVSMPRLASAADVHASDQAPGREEVNGQGSGRDEVNHHRRIHLPGGEKDEKNSKKQACR